MVDLNVLRKSIESRDHRLLERVAATLEPTPQSAVGSGWRLEEMKRGMDLTLRFVQY